jgi:hypothetical protein
MYLLPLEDNLFLLSSEVLDGTALVCPCSPVRTRAGRIACVTRSAEPGPYQYAPSGSEDRRPLTGHPIGTRPLCASRFLLRTPAARPHLIQHLPAYCLQS